jgi:integrase
VAAHHEQDATLFIVAACTGLRLGELLALRWSDVDFKAGALIVSRAMSRWRGVEHQVKAPPHCSSRRASSQGTTGAAGAAGIHEPHRSCLLPTGRRSARSFRRPQEQAGVRVRGFHDLRHTFGSLAIQQFDLVTVKDMMGHSKLTTTERYLHSKPRPDDVAKLTSIFT